MRRSVRVTVPPIRYGWDEDHISFALVIETGEPDSYREEIEADDHGKWFIAMGKRWSLWIETKYGH